MDICKTGFQDLFNWAHVNKLKLNREPFIRKLNEQFFETGFLYFDLCLKCIFFLMCVGILPACIFV